MDRRISLAENCLNLYSQDVIIGVAQGSSKDISLKVLALSMIDTSKELGKRAVIKLSYRKNNHPIMRCAALHIKKMEGISI